MFAHFTKVQRREWLPAAVSRCDSILEFNVAHAAASRAKSTWAGSTLILRTEQTYCICGVNYILWRFKLFNFLFSQHLWICLKYMAEFGSVSTFLKWVLGTQRVLPAVQMIFFHLRFRPHVQPPPSNANHHWSSLTRTCNNPFISHANNISD